MTIQHHPDPATLLSYTTGTLGEALGAVVASHLDLCARCSADVGRLGLVGGVFIQAVEPEPLSEGALDRALELLDAEAPVAQRWRRRDRPDGDLPKPIAHLVQGSMAEIAWKRLTPGIQHYRLPLSAGCDGDLRLLKIAAGQKLPDHGHGGSELTLVLAGAYRDSLGCFGPGDVADVDAEVEHQPIVEADADCICLVASERKARFKSVVNRVLQPLIGM